MSIMNEFEGFKKIKNEKNFTIETIFEALNNYKVEIGEIILNEEGTIIADIDGNYNIQISITEDNYIKIERHIDAFKEEATREVGVGIKPIDLAQADRMVDQIYDFLKTINPTGDVVEHITSAKRVLFVKQEDGMLKNHFYFTDENGNKKYEIKENKILKEFSAMNSGSRMEEFKLIYKEAQDGKYSIIKFPYTVISIVKKKESIKLTFNGDILTKKIQVSGDYSENHFTVELDEIVIGAIDSLNDMTKDVYRIEINDIKYEYLIVALTIIIDLNYNN